MAIHRRRGTTKIEINSNSAEFGCANGIFCHPIRVASEELDEHGDSALGVALTVMGQFRTIAEED
jgi:hypothetical protein